MARRAGSSRRAEQGYAERELASAPGRDRDASGRNVGIKRPAVSIRSEQLMPGLWKLISSDLRRKAQWCYESDRPAAIAKVLLTDGTAAMILYRLMQWARRWHLTPLEWMFNKLNGVACSCIIGRGAEFG